MGLCIIYFIIRENKLKQIRSELKPFIEISFCCHIKKCYITTDYTVLKVLKSIVPNICRYFNRSSTCSWPNG